MAQLSYDPALDSIHPPDLYEDHDSSFFRKNAPDSLPQLPTPAMVRAKCRAGEPSGQVVFEELGVFVKFGHDYYVRIEEAQAMQALRRAFPDNSIPLPELFGWRRSGGYNFIFMSLVQGVTLRESWSDLTSGEKSSIASQLGNILSLLRALAQPTEKQFIGTVSPADRRSPFADDRRWVGSISGTSVQGSFLRPTEPGAGPFSSVKDFNDRLCVLSAPWIPLSERLPEPFREMLPDTASICFSHGDLHFGNIIISGEPGSRSIVAIVDWGDSGWYPEYWEYSMMSLSFKYWDEDWLPKVLRFYPIESEAFGWYWNCNPP